MPGLEKRFARYAQLYSHADFVHQFHPLSTDGVLFLLKQKWDQPGLTLSRADIAAREVCSSR